MEESLEDLLAQLEGPKKSVAAAAPVAKEEKKGGGEGASQRCGECNSEVAAGDRFCGICGSAMAAAPASKSAPPDDELADLMARLEAPTKPAAKPAAPKEDNLDDLLSQLEDKPKPQQPQSKPQQPQSKPQQPQAQQPPPKPVVTAAPVAPASKAAPPPSSHKGENELDDLLAQLEEPKKASAPPPSKSATGPAKSAQDDDLEALMAQLDAPKKPATTTTTPAPRTLTREPAPAAAPSTPSNPTTSAAVATGSPMDSVLRNMSNVFANAETPMGKDLLGLSAPDAFEKDRALRSVINSSLDATYRQEFVAQDGVAPLVKLVSVADSNLSQLACHAVANLGLQAEFRAAFRAQGNAAFLAVVAAIGSSDAVVQEKALAALANLCVDEPLNRELFRKNGSTAKVVQCLASGPADLVRKALTAVVNSASDPGFQLDLVQDVTSLKKIVHVAESSTGQDQLYGVWALAALSMGGAATHAALAEAGGLAVFGKVLREEDPQLVQKALTAVVNMAGNDAMQDAFASGSILADVVAVLAKPSTPQNLLVLALQCTQNFGISAKLRAALANTAVSDAFMSLLRNHAPNAAALPYLIKAMVNLCADSNLRKQFNDKGAQDAVKTVSATYSNVAQDAQKVLTNLSIR